MVSGLQGQQKISAKFMVYEFLVSASLLSSYVCLLTGICPALPGKRLPVIKSKIPIPLEHNYYLVSFTLHLLKCLLDISYVGRRTLSYRNKGCLYGFGTADL